MAINSDFITNHVDPDTLGILWISNQSLLDKVEHFGELDYLFDGLLTNYNHQAARDRKVASKNFFVSQAYGGPFFLGHLKFEEQNVTTKDIDEVVSMASALNTNQSKAEEKNKVLVIGDLQKDILKHLSKKYKQYNFVSIS